MSDVVQRGLLPYGTAVVRGDSMRPTLKEGDRVLVRYGGPVRAGAVVVARLVDGTIAIKRVARPAPLRTGASGWWLLSDDPEVGVDSRHRGPVADSELLGVVGWRLWPRPGRVAARPRLPGHVEGS